MTDNQAFAFLSKAGRARDVKIILKNRRVGWLNILRIARQLRMGAPVAKIIRKKWFYGLPFYTDWDTLDPRPDSETLVEAVIKNENPARILDLGTGTGCLLCAILGHFPNAAGIGVDKSLRARRVARKNARSLGFGERIEIMRGTFANCAAKIPDFPAKGDIVISNPPYIPAGDKRVSRGARHDPKAALYGGKDGLKFYRQIANLQRGAKLYIEIGAGQKNAVGRIFRNAGWQFAAEYKDLSGRTRVMAFK